MAPSNIRLTHPPRAREIQTKLEMKSMKAIANDMIAKRWNLTPLLFLADCQAIELSCDSPF